MKTDLQAEVTAFVSRYLALSKGQQYEEKRAFWDETEVCPVLSPEEAPQPLIGWSEIDNYWSHSRGLMAELSSECWGIQATELDDALVLATYYQRWRARMINGGWVGDAPIAASVRVSMLIRRYGNDFKIKMIIESHMDGPTYFSELYRKAFLTKGV